MRVPDDVTLLWCDDNWGNIRRLPTPEERKRSGGAGIYYHFDYVGGPRNYKWINTNPIPKVWEQMNLALAYGADRIWIVNVGDLKPMEFPIEFFLNLACDPQALAQGEDRRVHAPVGGAGIRRRACGRDRRSRFQDAKYNGRRKPELLEPATYSLIDYQEADRVVADYKEIVAKAEKISAVLPENARDAFFELVLHPAKANAQVTELYVAAAKNSLYAAQGRAAANDMAAKTRALFQADIDLTNYYNHTLADGKWNHMMDQTHIGYTYWQEPPRNTMPARQGNRTPRGGGDGRRHRGFDRVMAGRHRGSSPARLRRLQSAAALHRRFQSREGAFRIHRHRQRAVDRTERHQGHGGKGAAPLGERGLEQGSARYRQRVGDRHGGGTPVVVKLQASNPPTPVKSELKGFVEADGYVSIEAEHFTRKIDAGPVHWDKIDDYGRTLSAMTVFPVTAASATPPQSPRLEYQMYLFDPAKVEVEAILSPTLNFVPGRGLRYAISFDDQPPQVIDALAQNSQRDWETTVKDSVRTVKSSHTLSGTGYHTLKIWMVDPALVLEKLVVNLGGVKPSYLGPPESYRGSM